MESDYSEFRKKAEEFVGKETIDISKLSENGLKRIIHDLEVHQVELEMQNNELQEAQNKLSEANKKYYDLFEFAPIGYLSLDQNLKIVDANHTFSELTNQTKKAIIGKVITDFIDPDFRDGLYQAHRDLIKLGNKQILELKIRKNAHDTAWVSIEFISRNNNQSFLVSFNDISQQKKAKEDLEESEKRYKRLAENAQDMIYRMSLPDGKYEYVSPSSINIWGYTPEEVYNSPLIIAKTIHPDWVDYFKEKWEALSKGQMDPAYECQIIDKSGKIKWLSQRNVLVKNDEGRPIAIEGAVTDITEQKKAEEALLTSQAHLQALMENTEDYMLISDDTGTPVLFNSAYKKIMKETIGLDMKPGIIPHKLLPDKEAVAWWDKLHERVLGGEKFRVDFSTEVEKGNTRHFESSFHPIFNGDKVTGFTEVSRDITERKNSEIRQAKLLQNLDSLWNLAKSEYKSINELADTVLNEINLLSDSEYSFYGFMNDDETVMRIYSWSKDTMQECNVIGVPIDFEIEKAGLWAEAVRLRKSVVYNDYSVNHKGKRGLPEGHVELTRLITVPILQQGKIVAVATVANKKTEYTNEDVKKLESFLYNAQIVANQKQAELELLLAKETAEENEEKYSKMVSIMPDGVVIHQKGKIVFCNESAYQILKYRNKEDLIGKNAIDFVHPDYRKIALKRIKKSQEENTLAEPIEEVFIDSEGEPVNVYVAAKSFIYNGKRSMLTIFTDITNIKKAEKELREAKFKIEESELKFCTIFENSPVGIFRSTKEGRFIEINQALTSMLGYKNPKEALDSIYDIAEQIYVETQKREEIVENANKAKVLKYENVYKRKNGEHFYANLYLREIIDEKGNDILEGMVEETTELVLREKALVEAKEKAEESEKQLKKAQKTSKVGNWVWYINDNKLWWSDEMYNIFEIDKDNFSGNLDEVIQQSIHKDDREAVEQSNASVIMHNKPIPVEYRIKTKKGNVKYVLGVADNIVLDENGKSEILTGIVKDITDHKLIQLQLERAKSRAEKSETRLKRMFDSMNSGVAVYKPTTDGKDFKFIDFNKAAERITRIKKDEVLGKTLLELFPNMDKAPLFKAFQKVNETGEDIHLPPFYYKDNTRHGWRENYIYKLPTGEIVAIFDDVTKREEARQALAESENKFRTIFEMTEDMICIADIHTATFIDINPSFSRILGYTEEELLSRPFTEFIHRDDVQKTIDVIEHQLQKGSTVIHFTNRYRCKDGDYKWLDWNSHPIPEKDITYAVAHDITEIKRFQDELEKHKNKLEELVQKRTDQLEKTLKDLKDTEAQLIQSEKMASLGVLTAGVAHEINNPLNYIQSGIYGLQGLLQKELDIEILQNKIKDVTEIMQKGVHKAANIVKTLNTFSRKGTQEKTRCDIHSMIDSCLLILNHEIKGKIDIKKDYTKDNYLLMGREENLHQVFINILMNAVQALGTNGKIKISTMLKPKEKKFEIVISDNGEGISKENLKKIFDPFFTTKDPGKGVGIGLSIVYKIIKEHKGTIKFESELSKGTDVIINLPVN